MCFTLPTQFVFLFFGVIISDRQLPKFTEKRIKLHKIAYKMTKNFLRCGGGGRGGGKKGGWDVRIGGKSAMAVGGIDVPVYTVYKLHFTVNIKQYIL